MRGWRSLWVGTRRLAWIVRVVGRHGLAHRFGGRWPWLARWLESEDLPPPERLRACFEELGGTFVKFGQMLALQPDILSVEYCDALFKLLDRIEPFPFAEVERILEEELGRPPAEIFERLEAEPLATASVGQVHVGVFDGRKVAVKVQRPNVELEFASDIRLMVVAMHLIRWLRIRPLYWLIQPTSEFVAWSEEELDYRYEARYAEELRRFAVDNPVQYVPAVESSLTTRRTLVTEFLDGLTLLDYLRARDRGDRVLLRRLAARGFEPERFAANVVGNFLGDAFRHGVYHADLHPANLMILDGNVVGYLDFGITGLMSRYSRRHLLAMTLALARGDVETMKAEYLKITGHDESSDLSALRAGLDRLADDWYETTPGGRRLAASITRIFNEMLALSRRTGFLPERDIVKYIRSAIALDGLLKRFDPSFDLGAQIGRSCARHLSWQGRGEWLSAERLRAFAGAGGRLLLDGPARAGQWLDALTGSRAAPAAPAAPSPAARVRCLQLAGMVFATALLIAVQPPAALGFNLWTAELAFAAAASLALLGSLRRLQRA